jgi:hypothetical protein
MHKGDENCAQKIKKSDRKKKPRHRWENNIKM